MRRLGIILSIILATGLAGYRFLIQPTLPLFTAQQYAPYFWTGVAVLVVGWLIVLIRFLLHLRTGMARIDRMDGIAFEEYTAQLLVHLGFTKVKVTPASRDQGVDIIAEADGESFGIQCKRYNHSVDNSAVQQVFTGCAFYHLTHPVVISNAYYTNSAKELAAGVGVRLIDRDELAEMISDTRKGR